MKRILILVALTGCGSDPKALIACEGATTGQCEIECVAVGGMDAAASCEASNAVSGMATCNGVATVAGVRGCCRSVEPEITRWFECEGQ